MSDLFPKFFKAHSDSEYFAELFAWQDTEIKPEDAITGQEEDAEEFETKRAINLQKKELRRGRLIEIKKWIDSNGFKLIESSLMYRIRLIEQKTIWRALLDSDLQGITKCVIEHTAIMRIFESFANVSTDIKQLNAEIKDLFDNTGQEKGQDDED